jgi:putative lipase involved disintegration of autophagic bodies
MLDFLTIGIYHSSSLYPYAKILMQISSTNSLIITGKGLGGSIASLFTVSLLIIK